MPRRLVLALAVATAACRNPEDPGGGAPTPLLRALPRALSSAERTIVRGSNDFSLRLLREVNRARSAETVVLSPFSVTSALGMAANGAAGTTFDAMRSTLGLSALDTATLRTGYRDLFALVRSLDPTVTTEIANSVWYSPSQVAPLPAFLQTSHDYFGADIRQADFNNPATTNAINGWVSTATRGMIPKIVESTSGEVMALINAIYFKAGWRWTFPKSATAQAPFTTLSGAVRQVPMMSTQMPIRLTQVAGATAGELIYGNGAYGLVVLLPDRNKNSGAPSDVNDVVNALTTTSLDSLAAAFADTGATRIDVKFPRLTVAAPFSLRDPLSTLGMGLAFSDAADFSRINGSGGLSITRVEHLARMIIDEDGTTAAAATYVGIGLTSAGPPTSFVVDRPFVMLLRDRLSGTLLFVAKVVDVP